MENSDFGEMGSPKAEKKTGERYLAAATWGEVLEKAPRKGKAAMCLSSRKCRGPRRAEEAGRAAEGDGVVGGGQGVPAVVAAGLVQRAVVARRAGLWSTLPGGRDVVPRGGAEVGGAAGRAVEAERAGVGRWVGHRLAGRRPAVAGRNQKLFLQDLGEREG